MFQSEFNINETNLRNIIILSHFARDSGQWTKADTVSSDQIGDFWISIHFRRHLNNNYNNRPNNL